MGRYFWGFPDDRLKESGIQIYDRQNSGSKIAVCVPDPHHCRIFNIDHRAWYRLIFDEIRKHTDREIIITHRKQHPVWQIYKDLHCVVSFHSNCWIHALILGIPVITTCKYRGIGHISRIEDPDFDQSVIKNMFYKQWTISEFQSGQAWEEFCFLSKDKPTSRIEDSCETVYYGN